MFFDLLREYSPFKENPTNYVLRLCLPGVGKSNIQVKVQNSYLVVKVYESTLSYSLPSNVNLDKVQAKYEDGILSIYVDKDKSNTRDIEIT
jgi:HSP20 family molecular chaperone IbpA